MAARILMATLAGAVVAGGCLLAGSHTGTADAAPDPRPNVVVVVTDDQESSSFNPQVMPKTFRLLRDGGTRLSGFTIATPLCCPSRAAQLTGQYGHNNGVLANDPGYQALRDPDNVLPVWLQRAGYRTAHVGRFLNGYGLVDGDPASAAPGWDRWIGLMGFHYRDYELSIDGRLTSVTGGGHREYVTRDLHRRTDALLRELADGEQPFYLQLDELAPHADHHVRGTCSGSAAPGPGGLADVRGLPGTRLPAGFTGERDIGDKPSHIRRLPPIDARQREAIERRMRCRSAAVQEVDRGIGRLAGLLRRLGELDDTVFILYSDNGFFDGQHRIAKSKALPYEPSIRVPAMIRVPVGILGGDAPRRLELPTSNIDIAPTILDLAEARPCAGPGDCRVMDGRSIIDALTGDSPWSPHRPILIELDQRGRIAGGTLACSYTGVRTGGQLFVEYESVVSRSRRTCRPSTELEHYRLGDDPRENHNLWPPFRDADRAAQDRLRALMERLSTCNGNAADPNGVDTPPENPCE